MMNDPALGNDHKIHEEVFNQFLYLEKGKPSFVNVFLHVSHDVLLKIFENNNLKLTLPDDTNDPFENKPSVTVDKNASVQCPDAFLCFSKTCMSPTMWAHYANRHDGYCIQFTFPTANVSYFYKKDDKSNSDRIALFDILQIEGIGNIDYCFDNEPQAFIELSLDYSDEYRKEQTGKRSQYYRTPNYKIMEKKVRSLTEKEYKGFPPILWDIRYTNERPQVCDLGVGNMIYIPIDTEKINLRTIHTHRLFVTKSSEWSYEKEVRIFFNTSKNIEVIGDNLFIKGLNKYITNVFMGMNNHRSRSKMEAVLNHHFLKENHFIDGIHKHQSIHVYKTKPHDEKYQVEPIHLPGKPSDFSF